MSKYTRKIKNFLKTDCNIRLPKDTSIIDKIYNSVIETFTNKRHTYKLQEKYHLKPLSTSSKPMMYYLFNDLKNMGFPDITHDISDFRIFLEWYRTEISNIDFNKIHNYKNKSKTYSELFSRVDKRTHLHDKIYQNNFIGIDIQHDIELSNIICEKYIINDKHTVLIYTPRKETDNDIIRKIEKIINLMEKISGSDKRVDLTIILSGQKKKIYPDTKIICCDNINSGSTYPSVTITCWRSEELYKVLIHELIHFYNLDFHHITVEDTLKLPKVHGHDIINESYVETLAIIINSLIISGNILNYKRDNLLETFNGIIREELSFVIFQVSKVLNIFQANNFDDYVKEKIIIKQTTSFRSYFIIKMLLMTNLSEFLEFINHDLHVSSDRVSIFYNLINKSYDEFNNGDIINRHIILLNKEKKNDWIYQTCRMSVNDF